MQWAVGGRGRAIVAIEESRVEISRVGMNRAMQPLPSEDVLTKSLNVTSGSKPSESLDYDEQSSPLTRTGNKNRFDPKR